MVGERQVLERVPPVVVVVVGTTCHMVVVVVVVVVVKGRVMIRILTQFPILDPGLS